MRDLSNAHWRDSARGVRFFMLDGDAVFPLVLVLIWPRLWTLYIALAGVLFFTVLTRFGLSAKVFFRMIRTFISGRYIFSRPWWMR